MTFPYAIAGRVVSVEPADEWSARLVSSYFRDFYLQLLPAIPKPAADFTIEVSSRGPAPAIPVGLDSFEVAFGRCYTDGNRLYLTIEDSVISTGVAECRNALCVWIGDTPHARESLSLFNLMSYALDVSLRRCGLYQLHGAGLVTPDGKACALILGASGSGKSTFASVLASRGWRFLTDDALLLNEAGGIVHARGIRRFFSASDATLASCSLEFYDQAVGGPMLSDPQKRRLEPLVAFPGQFMTSCIPSALFFVSITGKTNSEVEDTTRPETMARLIRSNPWASYDSLTARDHLRILNRLNNQCRAFSLRAGLDILNDSSCAERLLLPLLNHESPVLSLA
jgi:hypothetical protein